MSKSLRWQLLVLVLGVLALVVTFAASTNVLASPPSSPQTPQTPQTAEEKKPRRQAEFPHHGELEYERSVIRIPIRFGGDKKPREIVELTAFMKLEREAPVRNTIGYRQFEFTIREWELFGYSETLGGHISFAASQDVIQPKSLCVALQKDKDFPAMIVYSAIYDVFLDGRKILSQKPGLAMARGVVEIPPRNVTVAFQKPFMITRRGNAFLPKHDVCASDPYSETCACQSDPNCTILDPGSCEDMSTITAEEFKSGLREAKAIRERAATLKVKPPRQGDTAPGAGGGHR